MTHADDRNLAARTRGASERPVAGDQTEAQQPIDPAELAKLEQAVRSLRRLDRDIFLAARLDAMSYEAVAERTGLSVRQVERRLARALREIGAFTRDQPNRRRWCRF